MRYQQPKRMGLDQIMKSGEVIFSEAGRDIHERLLMTFAAWSISHVCFWPPAKIEFSTNNGSNRCIAIIYPQYIIYRKVNLPRRYFF
jgi:hypothetical protein